MSQQERRSIGPLNAGQVDRPKGLSGAGGWTLPKRVFPAWFATLVSFMPARSTVAQTPTLKKRLCRISVEN
jgi:hypothetical protein